MVESVSLRTACIYHPVAAFNTVTESKDHGAQNGLKQVNNTVADLWGVRPGIFFLVHKSLLLCCPLFCFVMCFLVLLTSVRYL
jgi:hypothetical protein